MRGDLTGLREDLNLTGLREDLMGIELGVRGDIIDDEADGEATRDGDARPAVEPRD
jgi:hypothetical protein